MWMLLFLLVLVVFGTYRIITANYEYWKKRGVPHPSISIFFGNLTEAIFVKKSLAKYNFVLFSAYPHLYYVGFYKIRQPAILVRSPELLKDILVKEFSSFHDNDFHIDEKTDPMFGKNPFVLKGDRWKNARNRLTPCFTGKKLRSMFRLMEEAGKNMVNYLNQSPEAAGKDGLETKELASKFTLDVVASCAFGIEGRAFDDANSEFREIGKKFLIPSFTQAVIHNCVMIVPFLANILNMKIFPDEVANYFRNLIRQTMKYREENNIVRGDFLDIMKSFKNKLGGLEFNDEDIAAHAAGFYDDVQIKLRKEIDTILAKNGGTLNHDDVQDNCYLNNVVLESLRKYPPLPFLAKTCTKSFNLPSPFGEGKGPNIAIETGMPVLISSYAIQRDPTYYPDPEKFDPDRFSKENRENRPKCTFLTFGEGLRSCLGQRFAITQVKVAVASVISNFEVRLNKKTIVPLQIDPQYFFLKAKGDIWLNYYKRK